jgi:hypothetical protein
LEKFEFLYGSYIILEFHMVLGYPPEDVRQFIISHRHLPYDAEVEWLESTGTQWIDTGLTMAINTISRITFKFCAIESSSYMVMGGNTGRRWYGIGGDSNTVFFRCAALSQLGYYNLEGVPNTNTTDWFTAIIDTEEGPGAASYRIEGYDKYPTTAGSATIPIYLFAGSGTAGPSKCRISSFDITDIATETKLLDMVSVRFTNELGNAEGAMYNRLGVGGMNPDGSPRNDGLYRNQGTGSFAFGDDI